MEYDSDGQIRSYQDLSQITFKNSVQKKKKKKKNKKNWKVNALESEQADSGRIKTWKKDQKRMSFPSLQILPWGQTEVSTAQHA